MKADTKEIQLPALWNVEQLRITYFPSTPIVDMRSHVLPLFGERIESEQSVKSGGIESFTAEEQFESGYLVARVQANRIDVLAVPRPAISPDKDDLSGPQPLTFGLYDDVATPFLDRVVEYVTALAEITPASRLAVGMILLFPVRSKREGYEFLDGLLPYVRIEGDDVGEFLYRINRRRPSSVVEAAINRVNEWSIVQIKAPGVTLSPHQLDVDLTSETYLARLFLDVNTVPEYEGPIPVDSASLLAKELWGWAKELATQGDVA